MPLIGQIHWHLRDQGLRPSLCRGLSSARAIWSSATDELRNARRVRVRMRAWHVRHIWHMRHPRGICAHSYEWNPAKPKLPWILMMCGTYTMHAGHVRSARNSMRLQHNKVRRANRIQNAYCNITTTQLMWNHSSHRAHVFPSPARKTCSATQCFCGCSLRNLCTGGNMLLTSFENHWKNSSATNQDLPEPCNLPIKISKRVPRCGGIFWKSSAT